MKHESLIQIVIFAFFLGIVLGFTVAKCAVPDTVDPTYKCLIRTDKSEKIPQVVSNAVNDIVSRKFVVVSQTIEKDFRGYKVIIGGIDIGDLIRND